MLKKLRPIVSVLSVFLSISITANASESTSSPNVLVAVGRDNTNPKPLIAVSNNGGETWWLRNASRLPVGNLWGVSCTDVNCVTAGTLSNFQSVLVSTDGGGAWEAKAIANSPSTPD